MVDDAPDGAQEHAVEYGWSAFRHAATQGVVGAFAAVAASLIVGGIFAAFTGEFRPRPSSSLAFYAPLYGLFYGVSSTFFTRSLPPFVRLTADGLELAAGRCDAAFVPWSATPTVRTRWIWPLTTLYVTVSADEESQVKRIFRGGRRPLQKRKGDQIRVLTAVSALTASPATILGELRRRGLR